MYSRVDSGGSLRLGLGLPVMRRLLLTVLSGGGLLCICGWCRSVWTWLCLSWCSHSGATSALSWLGGLPCFGCMALLRLPDSLPLSWPERTVCITVSKDTALAAPRRSPVIFQPQCAVLIAIHRESDLARKLLIGRYLDVDSGIADSGPCCCGLVHI